MDKTQTQQPPQNRPGKYLLGLFAVVGTLSCITPAGFGQQGTTQSPQDKQGLPTKEKPSTPAGPVNVKPRTEDKAIRERLESIMQATGKYKKVSVVVKNGVVFLEGQAKSERLKEWAAETAGKIEDVVAVFNGIDVAEPSPWDFEPALAGLQDIWFSFIRSLPFIAFGMITTILAWFAALLTTKVASHALQIQLANNLLRQVVVRGMGFLVFLSGMYIVLQVAGLTRLALTVLGGTGLLGLVLGIAFREITENFLASIFLSTQQPFRRGDLVEIADVLGFVQSLTYRVTILMTQDGNHVQIPNSTVYRSNIRNFTSNPNLRQDFVIGIGYDTVIADAQVIALEVLANHPAVLADPEPWVLVDSLGAATVNLRIYFWLDVTKHSYLKVKSSVIRLVKRAFQDANISLPDEAREIVFPKEVPVRILQGSNGTDGKSIPQKQFEFPEKPELASIPAEGGLESEAKQIGQQARLGETPEGGENLLVPSNNNS